MLLLGSGLTGTWCCVSVLCVFVLRCHRINSCVGQANHRSFLLTLCVFVSTSLYGISLVLCSLCPRQYLMTALLYCPAVYSQSRYSSTRFYSVSITDCRWRSTEYKSRWEIKVKKVLQRNETKINTLITNYSIFLTWAPFSMFWWVNGL